MSDLKQDSQVEEKWGLGQVVGREEGLEETKR